MRSSCYPQVRCGERASRAQYVHHVTPAPHRGISTPARHQSCPRCASALLSPIDDEDPAPRDGQAAPALGPDTNHIETPRVKNGEGSDLRVGTDRVDHDVELFGRFKQRAPNVHYLVDADRADVVEISGNAVAMTSRCSSRTPSTTIRESVPKGSWSGRQTGESHRQYLGPMASLNLRVL